MRVCVPAERKRKEGGVKREVVACVGVCVR